MSNTFTGRYALVTGANRGIGFEVCRQLARLGFTVILGARDSQKGQEAAGMLGQEGLTVLPVALDVASVASVESLAEHLRERVGVLDVLVNNAAINFDMQVHASSADVNVVRDTLETNLFGAWRLCEALLPLLKASQHGRIVNVSSEAGSLTSPGGVTRTGGTLPAYGVSKAALNAFTIKLAADLAGTGILVNAVCPGFTATQPGMEAYGARPVADGAASVVWGATLPDDGPSGGFFRDGKPLPW